jgi:hypothetical protein
MPAYNLSKELISSTSHSRMFVVVAMTNCSIPCLVLLLSNNYILLWTIPGNDIYDSIESKDRRTCCWSYNQ